MKVQLKLFLLLFPTLIFGQSKDLYQKIGDSLMKRGASDEIINYFNKELTKYPKNEDILRWLGYVYITKNKLDLGERYYTEALANNPKCARCYLNIGRIYSLRGDNNKALEYFDKAVNTDPKDAIAYSSRARLKEMLHDKFGALRDHNKAIEIAPDIFDYYVERALYNANSGYPSLAVTDLTKAIELAPNNFDPYFQRASIYYEQKRFDEALKDINKAIELDSNQYSVYTGRGAIFDATRNYEKALQDYSKAISLNKTGYLAYLNRASSFYKIENMDAACLDYSILKSKIETGEITDKDQASEINAAIQDICDSTKPSYYYQRGVGFYNLKEYQKALDIYTRGLIKFPEHAIMFSFKGNAYLSLNQYEQALICYSLSLKFKENIFTEVKANPRFANASIETITNFYKGSLASTYYSISECKVNQGLYNDALGEINTALELAPDIKDFNKEAYYNLRGHIYLTQKKYELSINDFNKSIQRNKNFPLAYVNLAIAKVSLAEKVKASSQASQGNFNNQPMRVTWNLPNKSSLKKTESTLVSALGDCNSAIEIDNKLGFAYYIRGQIKQLLFYDDYCIDLLTAQELGLSLEPELLKNCKK